MLFFVPRPSSAPSCVLSPAASLVGLSSQGVAPLGSTKPRLARGLSVAGIALVAMAGMCPKMAAQTTYTVTNFTDTSFATLEKGDGFGPGSVGDLRYELYAAMAVGGTATIDFSGCTLASPCTIVLGAPLPPIYEATGNTGATAPASFNLTVNGGQLGAVIIDGNSEGTNTTSGSSTTNRVFFVDNIAFTLKNIVIQNATAHGGSGGAGGYDTTGGSGGGGAGFGAGLFVNQAGAVVNVENTIFSNLSVIGGAGGPTGVYYGQGGGGGLAFAGGSVVSNDYYLAGSGGGGVSGAGENAGDTGDVGGAGGGGGGYSQYNLSNATKAPLGGSAYGSNAAGSTGPSYDGGYPTSNVGGIGGFGGGGGGGANGGFGGGGGGGGGETASASGQSAGNGGFGGGGGGWGSYTNFAGTAGTSAAAVGGVQGGSGADGDGPGGGGGAAGPAIFVLAGSVTLSGVTGWTFNATAGAGGGYGATPGTASWAAVFNYGGKVDGSATVGGIETALPGGEPVGTKSATQIAYVSITTAGTPYAINVSTQGNTALDYVYVSGGTCSTTTAYTVGQTCSVEYTFQPIAPGLRLGGITLKNSSGTVLASTMISGVGTGPLAEYTVPTESTYAAISSDTAGDAAFDGNGNLYVETSTSLYRVPAGGGTPVVVASQGGTGGRGVAVDGVGNVFYSPGSVLYEIPVGSSTGTQVATLTSADNSLIADAAGNIYYVSEQGGGAEGTITKLAAGTYASSTVATLGTRVIGMTMDAAGNIYAAGFGNNTIYLVAAGTNTAAAVASGLNDPYGIAVDAAGDIFVANYGNGVITRLQAGTYAATTLYNSGLDASFMKFDPAGNLYYGSSASNVYVLRRGSGIPLTFGSVAVGSTGTAQTLNFENDGNTSLSIASIAPSTKNFTFAGAVNGTTPACGSTLATGNLCGLSAAFTPQSLGTLTANGVVTDNSLNGTGAVQTVTLSGTTIPGTKTITFPQPPSQAATTSYTLSASTSNGDPVTYSITSGPATVSGSVVTYNAAGTVVIAANSAASANYYAAATVSDTVTVTSAPTSYTATTTNVNSTSATQTAYVTILFAGTPSAISVVTQGATGSDFNPVSGGTCSTSVAYTAGQTCSVLYSFTPKTPGLRLGAVVVTNASGSVVGQTYLSGTGTGPQALYTLPTQSTYSTISATTAADAAFDGSGDLYVLAGSTTLYKVPAGGGSPSAVLSGLTALEGIAVDGIGNIFFTANSVLYKISAGASTATQVATLTSADNSLVVDTAGNLYYSSGTGVITKVAAGTYSSGTVATVGTRVVGLAIDATGNLFAAGYGNGSIYKIAAGASTATQLATGLSSPDGIVVDAAGNLYVSGYGSKTILRLQAGSYAATTLGSPGFSTSFLKMDTSGNLYFGSSQSNVYKLTRTTGAAISFPTTGVGTTSAAQTFTFENDGNAALPISSVAASTTNFTFAGSAVGSFSACGTSLASGALCGLSTAFAPGSAGALSATGAVTDSSLNVTGTTQTVALSGTAIPGTKTITFPQPQSQLAGTSYTLTATTSNGDPVTYTITSGPATVSGSVVTYTAPGSVVIAANSAATANYNAAATVSDTVVVPVLNSFTAPNTAVGTTSATQTAGITFTMAGTVSAIQVLTSGSANLDYTFISGGTCAVGTAYTVGQTCTVQYAFQPTAPGQRQGAVVLVSATPSMLATSYLQGTGTGPLGIISPGTISTVAGNGSAAFAGDKGAATSAELYRPYGVSLDGAGNIYFADTNNQRIRKVTAATGIITTVAGNGSAGFAGDNGAATSAELYYPYGLSVDGAGNIYIADEGNERIRKVTVATGLISTVAGNGSAGFAGDNGAATSAELYSPAGVSVDGAGNIYIADYDNSRIRKVTVATGLISTVAGNGSAGFAGDNGAATSAELYYPYGASVDGAGNIYIADYGNSRIRKVTAATGLISTVAGNGSAGFAGDGGSATSAELYYPVGVSVDGAGNLYIADFGNSRIRKVTAATASISTVAGNGSAGYAGDGGAATSAELYYPFGVSVDGAGNLYVADTFDNLIRKVTASAAALAFSPGSVGTTSAAQTVVLNNLGNLPLTILSIASTNSSFTFAASAAGGNTACSTTLASGDMCGLAATFAPLSVGTLSGFGNVTDNSLNATSVSQTVALSGTATQGVKTITFAQPPTPANLNSTVTLTAAASDGDPVIFTITAGTATISGTTTTSGVTTATITYTTAGTLTIAANSPTTANATAAAQVTQTVTVQTFPYLFVINGSGSLATFSTTGAVTTSATAGGGIGAAIDASGNFWSINTSGNSVSEFNSFGALNTSYSGAGIASATALAIDGNGVVWIVNGGGTVSGLTNAGAAVSTTPYAAAAGINAPASITVDAAGSLWITNSGNNTVTEIIGVAAPVTTPTVQQVINSDPGTKP